MWFIPLLLTAVLAGDTAQEPTAARNPTPSTFQGGVCWVGPPDEEGLAYLARQGVGWISITSLGYGQKVPHAPPEGGYRHPPHEGETLEDVRTIIRMAHRVGLKVMLTPHIWFATGTEWRGDIEMTTEEDWTTWFRMYREFLQPYLEIAQSEKVDVFCIGTELGGTVTRETQWRRLIAHLRGTYHGLLTYGANWHDEYERVPFWDALDAIGVQAYFPLGQDPMPTVEQIKTAWEPWKHQMRGFSDSTKKPILLTEFGYKAVIGTTIEPWKWFDDSGISPKAQLNAYEGAFQALATEPWLLGVYVWKWFDGFAGGPRQRTHLNTFSPQGFPAEQSMFRWFKKLTSD